jgi:succinate dehydrogenase/fumarate reductase flavoprotein subunit
MKRQYWQEKPVLPVAFRGNTGDGIRMAQSVGADLWHMWHYHGTYGLRHPDADQYPYGMRLARFPDWTPGITGMEEMPAFFSSSGSNKMPWIVVDQAGRRYMNEYPPYAGDTGHRPMVYFDPVTQKFPRIPSYLILDRRGFENHAIGFPTYNDPKMTFAWSEDNRPELKVGLIKRAETIEGLAKEIGCDSTILRETIGKWNFVCRNQSQDEFGRDINMGVTLEEAPYFVAEVWPVVANTQGGPVRDARQRVLAPSGRPIEGLYSAGELGSVFGHLYISGGNLAECFIGGQIAGREAFLQANLQAEHRL